MNHRLDLLVVEPRTNTGRDIIHEEHSSMLTGHNGRNESVCTHLNVHTLTPVHIVSISIRPEWRVMGSVLLSSSDLRLDESIETTIFPPPNPWLEQKAKEIVPPALTRTETTGNIILFSPGL